MSGGAGLRRAAIAAALWALGPALGARAGAQLVSTLEAGTATLAYDNAVTTSAVTLTPALRRDGSRSTLALGGTVSFFEDGRWSSQGALSGSLFSRPYLRVVRAEIGGSAAGTMFEDRTRTGRVRAQVRVHVLTDARGLWAGATEARTWNGIGARSAPGVETGAWLRRGALTAGASLASSRWREAALPGAGDPAAGRVNAIDHVAARGAREHRYADLDASVSWVRGVAELGAFAGARRGGRDGINRWAGVGGTLWVSRQFALVAGAGSYPAELGQGLPGGRYATLALRVASRPPRAAQPPSVSRARAAELVVRGASADSLRTLRVRAPGAHSVELMGDFSDWRPIALAPAGGDRWEVTLPITAGAHRVNLRVDGGAWEVPPGVTPIADDFSGMVGVFVID